MPKKKFLGKIFGNTLGKIPRVATVWRRCLSTKLLFGFKPTKFQLDAQAKRWWRVSMKPLDQLIKCPMHQIQMEVVFCECESLQIFLNLCAGDGLFHLEKERNCGLPSNMNGYPIFATSEGFFLMMTRTVICELIVKDP